MDKANHHGGGGMRSGRRMRHLPFPRLGVRVGASDGGRSGRHHPLSNALALAAAVALSGCSALLDANRTQCSTDADCIQRGGAFIATACVDFFCQAKPDPKWGCLGNVSQPDGGAGPFPASLRLRDAVTQAPLPGVRGQLCRKLDVSCSEPLSEMVSSGADGLITFQVEAGFDGYVALTDPNVAPSLYFFNPPVVSAREPKVLDLSSPAVMALFASQIGAELESGRGSVMLVAQDCLGDVTAGVTYATPNADAATLIFYLVGMLPTSQATATDGTGFGGLVNVPTGAVTVTGTLAAGQRNIADLGLLVRASTVTYTSMVPLAD